MYHTIVARKTRQVFAALNRGDASPLLTGLAPTAEHTMDGSHPLGGRRCSHPAIEQWYARLFRLLPDLRFDVESVLVAGPPWRTVVAVEWRDRALDGRYVNRGVNVIRLRWGRVTSVAIHCDSQLLAGVLDDLAHEGSAEASAPPITDAVAGRR